MKKVTFAILAHVDAGKTTLSEAMLFQIMIHKKEKEVLLFFQKRSHLCIEKVK